MSSARELRFKEYHAKYPMVWRLFQLYSLEMIKSGHKTFGQSMIWEKVRYDSMLKKDPSEQFKLNDHYRKDYAMHFMKVFPEFGQVFELRNSGNGASTKRKLGRTTASASVSSI